MQVIVDISAHAMGQILLGPREEGQESGKLRSEGSPQEMAAWTGDCLDEEFPIWAGLLMVKTSGRRG